MRRIQDRLDGGLEFSEPQLIEHQRQNNRDREAPEQAVEAQQERVADHSAAWLESFFNSDTNAFYSSTCLQNNCDKALKCTAVSEEIINDQYMIVFVYEFFRNDDCIFILVCKRFYFSSIHFAFKVDAL